MNDCLTTLYTYMPTGLTVQTSFKLNIPLNLIIHSNCISMTETIGQGIIGYIAIIFECIIDNVLCSR